MAPNDTRLAQLAMAHLPDGAELATIDKPEKHAAVYAADITGDRVPELAVVYRLNDELYLLVLQYRNGVWKEAARVKGPGYGVTRLAAIPVIRPGLANLIVGWQLGAAWSKLSVYEWTPGGLADAAPADLTYSYMEAADMPGIAGRDGKAEIALWIHDTGEAYRVEALRWHNGAFVPAPDTYPYYFPGVARYYERMTRLHPDYPFYWYYLADAQYRAGIPQAALVSVRVALSAEEAYPSRETLLELERNIKRMLEQTGVPRAAGLYPASLKTTAGLKWGYIDQAGRMALPPRFEDARDFQENGLAVVEADGKYGLIDVSGRYVVRPVYDSIGPFSERRAIVIDGQGFRMIDESGTVLTRRAYPFIADMREGRSVFYAMNGGEGAVSRYGYLDPQGNEVIPAQYREAGDFEAGRALVKIKDNDYALIRPDGRKLAAYPYPYVGTPGDGLLAFRRDASGKYGYIDERGSVMIPPAFASAFPFKEGRAVVNTAEDYKANYGVIDKRGAFVIKPAFNDIRELGEERFALGRAVDPGKPYLGSVYAIADRNGNLLSDFRFTDVGDFKDRLASVTDGRQTYLIDLSGKPAPGYPRAAGSGTLTPEPGGLIKSFVDQRLSYLNRAGDVVWRQNTVIPLRPPYLVREEKYKPNPDYLVYYPQVEGMRDEAAERKVNARLKEMSQVKPIPGDRKLDYSYTGDFDVALYKQKLLELELTGYNYPFGAAHGMPTRIYAIIDLGSGRMYGLKDLFKPGSEYVKALSDIVGKQIKEDPQYSYVFPGSYSGIRPDQPFYVTERALHLYFQPYVIAPYAAGFPTFAIPFGQIMSLIDTGGGFWKSFHEGSGPA